MCGIKVATLATSEFVAVTANMSPGEKQVDLATDWTVALDTLLTEMKDTWLGMLK